jgi:hypothetical protein
MLYGVRLGIDTLRADYRPDRDERPEVDPRAYFEVPSFYGARLPRLVPRATLQWCEAIADRELVASPWSLEGFVQLFVLEIGRHQHVLATSELEALPFDRERLLRDVRSALFYDSYKQRSERIELETCRVRAYRSTEGLAATRLVLMPDFDNDAVLADGFCAAPTLDAMLVAQPHEESPRDAALAEFRAHVERIWREASVPLARRVLALDLHSCSEVSTGADGASNPTVPSPEAIESYRVSERSPA